MRSCEEMQIENKKNTSKLATNKNTDFIVDSFNIILGLCLAGLGTALTYLSGLGSSPIATLSEGISIVFAITKGSGNILINLILLIIVFVLSRKYISLGTFYTVFLIGFFTDFWLSLFKTDELPQIYGMNIILCVFGLIILSFGLSQYVSTNRGLGPLEAVTEIISVKYSKNYGISRMFIDGIILLIGILMGGTIGVGSVLNLLLVGRLMGYFLKK